MDYKVRLQQFEGPLDLLLFLIKKEEIKIHDIPIAEITQQYLEYIKMLEFLNLELAGEFLVMAATLMRIKARTLLPSHGDEEEEEEDPRAALVQQLLEYQKFKEAASRLDAMEFQRRLLYLRPEAEESTEVVDLECTFSLFDLITAFKKVLERVDVKYLEVHPEEISIDEKIAFLKQKIAGARVVAFGDLFEAAASRMDLIVTFLALLEILKLGFARVKQTKPFGEIWIHRTAMESNDGGD